MSRPFRNIHRALAVVAASALFAPAIAQAPAEARVETQRVTGDIYMLSGGGGNIGLFVGSDGPVLIDDEFAPVAPKVRAAVAAISDRPVRFLLNTHWHVDHAGGNEEFGRTGAIIVAQDAVRQRLSTEQANPMSGRRTPASPPVALPVITFGETLKLHLNGDDLEIVHLPAAHTDGDVVIRFRKANVVHTGDIFFNGMYPFIDGSSGGTLDGFIAAVDRTLAMTDENTRIIPGHGPLGTRRDLVEYRDMLVIVRDRIVKLVRAGRTQEQVIAAKPTAEFDAKWGGRFWKPEQWVGQLYVLVKQAD